MPQRVRPPSPGGNAEAIQTVSDHLPERAPVERLDRRAQREEKRAPEAGWADFLYVVENGLSDPSR